MEELRAASIVGGAARHMWLSRNGQRGGLAILGLCALLLGGTGAADASDRSPGVSAERLTMLDCGWLYVKPM